MEASPDQRAAARPARVIDERPELLDEMVLAARSQPENYRPGPYWHAHTRAAVREIKRHGLADFRGATSSIGTAFADNPFTDVRGEMGTGRGRPLKYVLERVFPFSRIMDAQVAMTRGFARDARALTAARMVESADGQSLLARYDLPDSTLGGCAATATVAGQTISLHYLRALQLIDRASALTPLDEARSLFEIGGFGANVHLLIEFFPRLRKIVYLDVPPNLYVGTCYLRTIHGDAVRDFSETRALDRIGFRDDDALEIIAICPWQIEALDLEIDLFWNANSFVEMPRSVVTNCARQVQRLPGAASTSIVPATYGGAGTDTMIPGDLPLAFQGREFIDDEFWALGWPNDACSDPERDVVFKSYLFVSRGSPARQFEDAA